jgi:hypothetical protein
MDVEDENKPWCAFHKNDAAPYFEVAVGVGYTVAGVSIKTGPRSDYYVKEFNISVGRSLADKQVC